jgi:hypothetical protein
MERAHENTAFHMLNFAHALDEVEVVGRRGFSKKCQLRAPRRRVAHDELWRAAARRASDMRALRACAQLIIPGVALERARDFYHGPDAHSHRDRAARHASTSSATNIKPTRVKLGIRTAERAAMRSALERWSSDACACARTPRHVERAWG